MKSKEELEAVYNRPDPWDYAAHPDDKIRIGKFLSILPTRKYRRAIDIGCGNGFLTREIAADSVLGVDLSEKAVAFATDLVRKPNIRFEAVSLFDLTSARFGTFDLIVLSGVLYPSYMGGAYRLAGQILWDLAEPGAILVSCHIDEWGARTLPFSLLRKTFYAYREYTHVLEVFTAI